MRRSINERILWSLFEAACVTILTSSLYTYFRTPTLQLEGRPGVAWDPPDKVMLFLAPY